ncbi:MAG: ABC transporter permease subunit [Atopobiaceae bacterium]|nr:ABC transporter permease subunit [Atopobiaceae bacterium]
MGIGELISTYGEIYLQSLMKTWGMTLISFCLAMIIALVITVMRVSPMRPLRMAGDLYVQIFRNIPGVSLLVIVVYALPYLQLTLPYETCALVTITLVVSAFASENLMTGINTIGVGQIEAARSVGLSFGQILRHVVIPQALRSVVLPMTNLLIGTLLTTALASQVPLNPPELTGMVNYVNSRSVGGIGAFFISALGYAGTSVIIGLIGNRLDQRVRILR